MGEPDWHDEHRAFLGMYHSDANQALLTWFNASPEALDVTLPEAVWGTSYEVLWHSAEDHEMPQLTFQPEASFTMPPRSVVVMKPLVRTLAGLDLEA